MSIFPSELQVSEERTENKVKIDWPDNPDFFQQRDKYISDNLQIEIKTLKEIHNFKDINIEEIARLICEVKFSFELISKISPIKLNYPVSFELKKSESGQKTEDDVMTLSPITNSEGTELISFALSLNLDEVINQAIWHKDKIREADAQYLSTPIHEFAHMIYLQQAYGENPKKMKEVLLYYKDEKYTKGLNELELKSLELATDLEIRSRIWQVKFLEKYFKYLEITRDVRTNLEQRQVLRRNVVEKDYYPN